MDYDIIRQWVNGEVDIQRLMNAFLKNLETNINDVELILFDEIEKRYRDISDTSKKHLVKRISDQLQNQRATKFVSLFEEVKKENKIIEDMQNNGFIIIS